MEIPPNVYLMLFDFMDKFGSSPYFKPALILGGIFFFIILFALVRKHIFEVSMKGAVFGFVSGVIIMLVLDLIIVFGMADKNKVASITKGENRQAAIQDIFISGVSEIGNVLGVSTKAVPKTQKPKDVEEVISSYLNLPQDEAKKFKDLLCPNN